MASFLDHKKEDIRLAQKIDELRPDPIQDAFKEHYDFKVARGLCWHVVFSPDESHFAWISSPKRVVLVPWDRERNNISKSSKRSEINPILPKTPSDLNEENRPWIVIESGYPVVSVAFGRGTPEQTCIQSNKRPKACWTRFDFTKEIILATGHTNGRIRIWDIKTGSLLLELMDHKSAVRDISFAPDGSLRLMSASLDKTLKGWDLNDDGNMFKTFSGHKDSVFWCCWSPNAKLLASAGSDKTVLIWDMVEYKLSRRLDGHYHQVVSCSFSPDGAVLATASWDTQVILWDPYTGDKLHSLHHLHPPPNLIYACGANSAWVRGVSYAGNGMNVVTISDDHFIRFWNIMGDVDPEGIAVEDEEAISCSYSPSGRCVAVGTSKFKVSFYTTPSLIPKLSHLCRMALRKHVETPDVDHLDIPNSLKSYLKYKIWN